MDNFYSSSANETPLSKIWSQFNKRACPRPPLQCRCCPSSFGGFYSFWDNDVAKKGTITICWNRVTRDGSIDYAYLYEILAHEGTHALQDCHTESNLDGPTNWCVQNLKREIEAYCCSGGCTSYSTCIRRAINSSCYGWCRANRDFKDDKILNQIKSWFDQAMSKGKLCQFPRLSTGPGPTISLADPSDP